MHKKYRVLVFVFVFASLLPASMALVGAQQKGKPKFDTWRQYLGGSDSSQYSALKQIQVERREARGRLDVSHRRHADVPVQPHCRGRRDVPARPEPVDRGG
jgi:hypothetical protein